MTKAHITLVVDRSGSMQSTKKDAEGGIKNFFEEQRKLKDIDIFVSVYQFDNEFETVIDGAHLDTLTSDFTLEPRGSTALLDAFGKSITLTAEHMADKYVVVVVTDGGENSSYEWGLTQVKDLIEEKKAEGWEFVFLSSDLSSIRMGQNIGLHSTRSSLSRGGMTRSYGVTGQSVSAYLAGTTQSVEMPDEVK